MTSRLPTGYSGTQITLHWVIAALVAYQLLFGEDMTSMIEAREQGLYYSLSAAFWGGAHYYVGIAILALALLRLIVRLGWGAPPPTQQGWMPLAAALSHSAFYLLLLAAPLLGLLAYYVGDPFGDLHAFCKPAFIVLIGLHAAAALVHQFWLKDGTLRRMLIPGQ